MKLKKPDWLMQENIQKLMILFEEAGFQIYAVGGCVRDTLLNRYVADIDLSTNARPDEITKLAEASGHDVVPTGIGHGTVTVIWRYSDEEVRRKIAASRRRNATVWPCDTFEITTFRKDVATDGRRAVVEFADTLEEDAYRRDFTMNALYATRSGRVIDPVGGVYDIEAHRIRFIGDPLERIKEDYLRILRFFRFYAHIGGRKISIDPDGLAACSLLAEGLGRVSRERIGAEILKLLKAFDPGPAVATMETSGVLARILPGATSRVLPRLLHLELQYPIEGRMISPSDEIARLASLGGEDVPDRLRLSKADTQKYHMYRAEAEKLTPPGELAYRHDYWQAIHALMLRWAVLEQPFDESVIGKAWGAQDAKFPLRAADLMPDLQGPALGAKLKELEAKWIASDFTLNKEQLLR